MGHARRRIVVVLACAGLLGLPAPAPAAAASGATAVFADDPQRGALTYDAATGATVTATLNAAGTVATVDAAQGDRTHRVTLTASAPLATGTYQVGAGVAVATDTCTSMSSGTVTITELAKDAGGGLATLAASYDGLCGGGRRLGTVRYHSDAPWWGVHAPPAAFGATRIGGSASRDVTISATGTQPVTLGAVSGVTAPFAVTADTCSNATVPAGGSCTVTVSFSPASTWSAGVTLAVPADGPRGAVGVAVTGHGVYPPAAPLYPRAVAGHDGIGLAWFPPSRTWDVPETTAYRVYRDGGAEPVATVTTPGYADPAAPGETHTYTVAAVAGPAGEGAQTAAVSATVPAAVTETTGDVTGMALESPTGGYATTAVTVTPAPGTVSFKAGADRWVALRPHTGSAWAPGKLTATVDGSGCFPNIAELTVHEAKVAADGTPATLAVSGVLPCHTGGPGYLELRYAAQTPLVAGDTTPDAVTAPVVKPGTTTAVTTVTVANGGSAPLDLGTAAAPAGWVVSDDTCSGTSVAPGASCTLGVAFAPVTAGVHDGTLTIPDNTLRGHRAVRLAGTASDLTAVRGLTATPLVGRVLLTYDAPEFAHPPVDAYVVSRASSPNGPWTVLAEWHRELRYLDPYATPGKHLYYKVHPKNADGPGPAATADAVTVGKELVYAADTGDGTYRLMVKGSPAGTPVRLTTSAKAEDDPSLTSGGSLAYVREDVPGRFHVYVSRADGTGARRAAGDVDGVAWTYRNPRMAPDRSRLAFACRPLTQAWWDLCVRSMSSGAIKKVPSVLAGGGSWLANGKELVVVSATSPPTIQLVAYDNSYRVAIPGTANARQVALSPDGQRIAWTRYEGDETHPSLGGAPKYSLRVSGLSGGAGTVLTSSGYSNDPDWSPDSGTVYFTHVTRTPGGATTRDVYSAPAAGGTPVRLTDTPDVDEDDVTVHDTETPRWYAQAPRPMADFSGDGKAELAVWRPGTGAWRIRGLPTVVWGRLGDIPVPGDYHGDRKAERAVFRPSTGTWHVYGRSAVKYGRNGDVPVPADYNGDGKMDLAVYRPSTGQWYVYGRAPVVWGSADHIPVPADYNGDRKADIAVYSLEHGQFSVRRQYSGWAHDGVPVPADYDGVGHAQPAVLDGKNWMVGSVWRPIATVPRTYHDVPAYGNFNGDRRAEPGVFNPTSGVWRVLGQSNVVWGVPGDIPV